MTAILTEKLTKNFGSLCAVDSLDLSVDREIFGLLGPNGSGKTTTVLMLTTLLAQTSGCASVCGHNTRSAPEKVRDCLSYVPAGYGSGHEPYREGEHACLCPALRD